MPKRIAVLVSGGGTNLQALMDYQKSHESCPYSVALVVSDRKDAFALERAKNAGIPYFVASPYAVLGEKIAKEASREKKRIAVSDRVLSLCVEHKIDGIVQAGWLTLLSGKIISSYSQRIINLHPSLLPKFGGIGMWGHHVHEAVLLSEESESGCTVHFVTSECDGGKIIVQKKVPVVKGDTPESLASRVAVEEHKAIVEGALILAESI